ncbi:hypothetical protein VHEMI02348 [[Torrubiella] hemipterigena]|uniref:ER transporter 6TM N-terminal domain-containing protein n=1 Tax=[Torrubiella] hemipterigena TaxID=1531966 RepID=A0A0A1T7L5_9HYPO|nr:hypothetical protein VHEMI02348 [[Torrubiella] hemipterigena]
MAVDDTPASSKELNSTPAENKNTVTDFDNSNNSGSLVADDANVEDLTRKTTDTTAPKVAKRALPAWLDHFNSGDLKVLIRCAAAAWVAFIIMFIDPVLQSIGVATFFASLVLFIVPPAGILMINLLASISMLVGMCLAWAWGLLTMKAARAARPDAETNALVASLRQTAYQEWKQTNRSTPTALASELVYNGYMLDTRVTVIYYVMGCLIIYVLARMRINNAKLILFQIFGTIITDLFILIGPLLSTFNSTLPVTLIKPGAIGVGIGTVFSILLFPQSTSYTVLDSMEKLVRLAGATTDSTRRRLADQAVHIDELIGLKGKTVGLYKAMKPALAFLPIDLSRGRWNVGDVTVLHEKVRAAMVANLSLVDFHIGWIYAGNKAKDLRQYQEGNSRIGTGTGQGEKPATKSIGSHQLEEYLDLLDALKIPGQAEQFNRVRESLMSTTKGVLDACHTATDVSARCIHAANSNRWISTPKQSVFDELAKEMTACLENLRRTKVDCVANTNDAVIEHHAELFDEEGRLKQSANLRPNSLQGIILAMVIEERILSVVDAMEGMLDYLVRLVEARKEHRIWLPTGLQYALAWLFNGKLVVPISDNSTVTGAEDPESPINTDAPEDLASEAYRRLRASHGTAGRKIRRGFFSKAIMGTYNWLFNQAGMYGLRMVIVTIATCIPASLPSTAGFFYREKGIWGVIMAQTCVLVYMADFTFSLVGRALGTVLGGAMGMVAWYIGAGGLGPGNPYGLSAIGALMIVILMWWRLFLPAAYLQAAIMTASTFVLVVGFSFDAGHIQQYGLPGVGYEAFWKRVVVVMLGFIASAVVQVFPKPPSATVHVSKTLSNTVGVLADHYALLLSHWARGSSVSPVSAVAEDISLNVADTLMGLSPSLGLLSIEVSSSPFDKETLADVIQHVHLINQSLSKLLDMSTTLPQDLQQRLGISAGLTNDRAIGQVMGIFGILEYSLRTGSPIPERLPAPLVRNLYDAWESQHRNAILTTSLVRDENYRRYCVAMSSYLQFLTFLDDLVITIKRAVGESHVVHSWEETA